MDLISELEELALASRLRRLSERLMRDVSSIYRDMDVDFRASWFPVIQALSRKSPLSVTETAHALGLTHPAVNQSVADLVKHDLVKRRRDKNDDRRILLELTDKGRATTRELEPVWREIRRSNVALLDEVGCDLLTHIEHIEEALDHQDMADRVRAGLGLPRTHALEIVDYRPAYKKHFAILNYEWLNRDFEVEDHDRRLLEDPNRTILRKGGAILFALWRGEVVGACALIKLGDDEMELCKMAVTPTVQGRGIGRALTVAVIERARAMGAGRLELATNPKLEAACHLYASLGFRRVSDGLAEQDIYQRCSISMRLDLC